MKTPKEMKRYCAKCKIHTLHKVKIEKNRGKNKAHPLTQFSSIRLALRGQWLTSGTGNSGARSRGAMNSWKRYNKKHSKKTDFRYTCSQCNKMSTHAGGNKRAKKAEMI